MNNNFELKYCSSGSYGIILKDDKNDFIYKITEFSDYELIYSNNFNEMLYLNYFRIKYPKLFYLKQNNLPIQNISTNIYTLDYFVKMYNINNELLNFIKKKIQVNSYSLIIVNKMKYYPYNLTELNQTNLNKTNLNKTNLKINEIYLGIEKIILGLHFFHYNKLAHGDLKSLNIVSNGIDDFKLVDFGGIKSSLNPQYQCTCTCTYRSPEEYKYENEIISVDDKKVSYSNCSLKSDIWSLGLVFNELVNKSNPINSKYSLIKIKKCNSKNFNEEYVEKKIYQYFKNEIKTKLISINPENYNFDYYDDLEDKFLKYKIDKIIEKMLFINPDERIGLDDIYLNLYYQELPDLSSFENKFNYDFVYNSIYFDTFINFRNEFYPKVKLFLSKFKEIYLYPFNTNLMDRFLIKLIDYFGNSLYSYSNKLNLLKLKKIFNDIFIDKNTSSICTNLLFGTIYIMSKVVVLKKNININKILSVINNDFVINNKSCDLNNLNNLKNIIIILDMIVGILEFMDYDIIRTELFFYSNTDEKIFSEIITIIDNFDIIRIKKYIG